MFLAEGLVFPVMELGVFLADAVSPGVMGVGVLPPELDPMEEFEEVLAMVHVFAG